MPSLKNGPDNAVGQLVAKIKKLITERRRLDRLLTANNKMTYYFEGISSLGFLRNMRECSSQILQIGTKISSEVGRLEQINPKHPLIKLCKKNCEEVV